jgi:hypothetical protein
VRAIVTPCDSGHCVEVAGEDARLFLRSTMNPERWLDLDREEWVQFRDAIKDGMFDEI